MLVQLHNKYSTVQINEMNSIKIEQVSILTDNSVDSHVQL